jgi:hypothetical protein
LNSLANPLRARNYARRCLLECFEREGLAFLKMTGSDDATKIEKKKVFSVFTPEGVNRNTPGSLCGDLTVFQEELSDGKTKLKLFLHY